MSGFRGAPVSAASVLVSDAKTLATNAISWLTGQVGQQLVADVWSIITGNSTEAVIHELTQIVSSVLTAVRGTLTDDEIAAAIQAANLAVDAEVDVLEAAEIAAKP